MHDTAVPGQDPIAYPREAGQRSGSLATLEPGRERP